MFDFRYHALSLVAVFLALGIGILLGATIGEDLVSEADRDVRSSLRGDVLDAREDARNAREAARRESDVIEALFDRVAEDRLSGRRIAIVSSGDLDDDIQSAVRGSVEDAGGTVTSVSQLARELEPAELADAAGRRAGGPRPGGAASEDDLEAIGARIGRSIVRGGAFAERLEEELPERFTGEWEALDAVVFVRAVAEERPEGMEPVEAALVEELADADVAVVGVEETGTEPSQVPFYLDRNFASVDHVDLAGARLALVLALDGAEGSFGVKDTAEAPLPPADDAGD